MLLGPRTDRLVVLLVVLSTGLLVDFSAQEPVGPPKAAALACGGGVLALVSLGRRTLGRGRRLPKGAARLAVLTLLAALVLATLASPDTTGSLLGAFGRGSGLVSYASALMVLAAVVSSFEPRHVPTLLAVVLVTATANAAYGAAQLLGRDPLPWDNPFNPAIGLLGNPNFCSAYLGVAVPIGVAVALERRAPAWTRAAGGAASGLCLAVAALSDAAQGPAAAAAGVWVVVLVRSSSAPVRAARWTRRVLLALAGGGGVLLCLALAGTGPLSLLFSQPSFTARRHYWGAALTMFRGSPATGVGLDQYGEHWRTARSPQSVLDLGADRYVNAAHSVPLQLLSGGGLPLGLAYAALVAVVGAKLWRAAHGPGLATPALAAAGGGWAAYQVQSFVSIDQVPLLVLHAALAGSVLVAAGAGSRATAAATDPPSSARRAAVALVLVLGLPAVGVAGTLPLRSDRAVHRGDDLLAAGDDRRALTAYADAGRLLPGAQDPVLRRAQVFAETGQPERARSAALAAASLDPYDPRPLVLAAESSLEQGRAEEAFRTYRSALRLAPLDDAVLVATARAGVQAGRPAAAATLLEEGLARLGPAARVQARRAVWVALGDARRATGDEAGAISAFSIGRGLPPG